MKSILMSPLLAVAMAVAIAAPPIAAVDALPMDHPTRQIRAKCRARPSAASSASIRSGLTRKAPAPARSLEAWSAACSETVFGGAATVIGTASGAVAGNNLGRNHRTEGTGYRVTVRLDNGRSRTFTESQVGSLRVGDRVRIQGGRLQRY